MPKTKDYVNHGGLSRQAIFQAVEASLKRLDTPYIDLLQIHRFDKDVPVEETMQALHDLVRSGKARYIGASSVSLDLLILAADSTLTLLPSTDVRISSEWSK
jgi:aryl-alcohol dehydrogenase-like predicted oxidoreductase